VADVMEYLTATPFWTLGEVFDRTSMAIFVIDDIPPGEYLLLGRAAFVSTAGFAEVERALAASDNFAVTPLPDRVLPSAARPHALAPRERRGRATADLERTMWDRCASMSWVGLASDARIEMGGRELKLEIFGLQRVHYSLTSTGFSVDEQTARLSLELFDWASGVDSTDQRLAVQQVASLYRDEAPWLRTADVFGAAQAVFGTLRRDAVNEVFLARRAARTHVIAVAQTVTEAVNALAKSTLERCVVTLLAIGGVIVARTVGAITEVQEFDLRVLVSLFLVALAVWSIAFEGATATSPLKSLKVDLPIIADLLTPDERAEVLRLDAVARAQRRATLARAIVPATYLAAAIAALLVG
jgi:hypothetical protein